MLTTKISYSNTLYYDNTFKEFELKAHFNSYNIIPDFINWCFLNIKITGIAKNQFSLAIKKILKLNPEQYRFLKIRQRKFCGTMSNFLNTPENNAEKLLRFKSLIPKSGKCCKIQISSVLFKIRPLLVILFLTRLKLISFHFIIVFIKHKWDHLFSITIKKKTL